MATGLQLREHDALPRYTVELTEPQLKLAMELATHRAVACEEAALAVQSGIGSPAEQTLATVLQEAWKSTPDVPTSPGDGGS